MGRTASWPSCFGQVPRLGNSATSVGRADGGGHSTRRKAESSHARQHARRRTTSVVGEHQMPIGGMFGDTPPAACEFCGGGGCLPPTWTVETSIAVMAMSRAGNQRLGTNSLPAGPLPAGSITVTNTAASPPRMIYTQYLNDAVQTRCFGSPHAAHHRQPALGPDAQPVPRPGRRRAGPFPRIRLQRSGELLVLGRTANGSIIPFYDTTPVIQAIPATAADGSSITREA